MRVWRWMAAVVLIALCMSGCACGRERRSADEILTELNGRCEALPAGVCYLSGAEEGDAAYLDPTARDALYGADAEEIFSVVEEYALYLSSFEIPYEVAVFRCYSATDANRVVAMCLGRAESLRVALRGTQWEALADGALVIGRGRYVVMAMVEDARGLRREALRLMR